MSYGKQQKDRIEDRPPDERKKAAFFFSREFPNQGIHDHPSGNQAEKDGNHRLWKVDEHAAGPPGKATYRQQPGALPVVR